MHLDIISARIFTWHDGTAADVFRVALPWDGYDQWPLISERFRSCISGQTDIAAILSENRLFGEKNSPAPQTPKSVTIDNETPSFFTLEEISAPDRAGLLHSIAEVLNDAQLSIHRAFINSAGHRAVDIFYVVDQNGEKLTGNAERIALSKRINEII